MPVQGHLVGLTHLFLYLDGPGADINMIMGREQYGISKKHGEIMYHYDKDECRATVVRYGVPLITLRLKWKEEIPPQKAPLGAANKCMWVKEIPNCTFTGYDVRKVICQDWGAAGKPKRLRIGQGSIELGHLDDDPVDILRVVEVGPAFESIVDMRTSNGLTGAFEAEDLLKTGR